uniref:major histocompatibility complex class I-related gene protein-like isoform X1 n=2 Tax=Pristiophorus japonicus TaxID=55135 RepID=UPI00398EE1A0
MEDSNRPVAGLHLTVLTLCTALVVHAGPHTSMHLYIHSNNLPDLPAFSVPGMLDNLQTEYYDSLLNKTEPRQQWMADNFADDYWLEQTKTADTIHRLLSSNIARLTMLTDVKYFQGLWGCTLYDNNSTNGFIKLHLNTFSEIECDTSTVRCNATGALAFLKNIITRIFTKDITFIQSMCTSCIQHLQKALQVGKAALDKKVAPKVLVFQRQSPSEESASLLCLITPFYPRAVNATWLRNGEAVSDGYVVQVLPNHDETYRMEILIEIQDNDPKNYSCQVQHSSLSKTLTVRSGGRGSSDTISPGPVLGLLAVLAIMAGVV